MQYHHFSGTGPFRDNAVRILDTAPTDNNPSSALQTVAGDTDKHAAISNQKDLTDNMTSPMVKYKGVLANGSASPLITEKGKQPSVGTFLNRQSMQSTEFIHDIKKTTVRTRSINSSVVSEPAAASSSCNTTQSPVIECGKKNYIKSRIAPTPMQTSSINDQSNRDLYNQRIAVKISQKRLRKEEAPARGQAFFPQPIMKVSNERSKGKNSKGKRQTSESQDLQERMRKTQVSLATVIPMGMLDHTNKKKNTTPLAGSIIESLQQKNVRHSFKFEMNPYQVLSTITSSTARQSSKQDSQTLPARLSQNASKRDSKKSQRKSDNFQQMENFSTDLGLSSQRPKILTFDQKGMARINFNNTNFKASIPPFGSNLTERNQNQSAIQNQAGAMNDAQCRYKELTWVKKGIETAAPIDYSSHFMKYASSQLRSSLSKRNQKLTEMAKRTRTLEPVGREIYQPPYQPGFQTSRPSAIPSTTQNRFQTSRQEPWLTQDTKSMQMNSSKNQGFESAVKLQQNLQASEVDGESQLPIIPKSINKQLIGQSEEQIIHKNDSVFSGMRTLKFPEATNIETNGSLYGPKRRVAHFQSILDTHTSSKDFSPSKASPQHATHQTSKASSVLVQVGGKERKYYAKNNQASDNRGRVTMLSETQNSWRKSSKGSHFQDLRPKRSYETFEITLGGKTDASIFFDGCHAEKMENEEFDKLFGMRKGCQFRSGQSVEIGDSRTITEQLNYLHPQLRDMLHKQYAGQNARIERDKKSPEVKTITNWQPSLVHSANSTFTIECQRDQQKRDFAEEDGLLQSQSQIAPNLLSQPSADITKTSQVPMSSAQNPILVEPREDQPSNAVPQSSNQQQKQPTDNNESEFPMLKTPSNQSQVALSIDEISDEAKHQPNLVIVQNEHNSDNAALNLQLDLLPRQEDQSTEDSVLQENKRAFATFKQLGGSFFRQPERQVIMMDNDGGLHYEPKNDFNNTIAQPAASPNSHKRKQPQWIPMTPQQAKDQRWETYKEDVLSVVKKGILSNEPKPKKIIKPPTPEPEIQYLLHLNVSTVRELLDNFDEEERDIFLQELIDFQSQEEPTRFLLQRIDELNQYPNDRYCVHLNQVYKMLFKKRIDMAHSRQRLKNFDPKSMDKHVESFVRKVYDEFVADVRCQLSERKMKSMMDSGASVEEASKVASKYMSQSKIKETTVGHEKKQRAEQSNQVVEYVKYLIGQTQNNDFELRREEFKQTHELHTRSLALPFDHYAQKEDNAMKKVANDLLERIEMSICIQEHMMPIAALKYADDPTFMYLMKIRDQMSLALPLLAKVVNKQLSLCNYNLSLEQCVAFGETCKFNHSFMSKLVLSKNGITDESLSALMLGLSNLNTISLINIRHNQVGQKSIRLIANLFRRHPPQHLQVLRLIDCNMDLSTTGLLLDLLEEEGAKLRALALTNASFNKSNEQKLFTFLKNIYTLRELDLSWNFMSQHAYIDILNVVVENNSNLLMLNLSHNQLIIDPKTFVTDEGQLIKQEKIARYSTEKKREQTQNDRLRKQIEAKKRRSQKFGQQQPSRLSSQGRQSRIEQDPTAITSGAVMLVDNNLPQRVASQEGARESQLEMQNDLIQNDQRDRESSLKRKHLQSRHAFLDDINETKAEKILNAETYVTQSSELNQLVTLLLTKVLKESKRLQHLDLSSTNLPSQVIIHLCNRLRKSRSVCSVHFTDNPGLEEASLAGTIFNMLKCKKRDKKQVKIDVNKQVDFALNSNMLHRLQQQLVDEKTSEGEDTVLAANTIRFRQIMQQKRIEQKASDLPQDISQNKMILSRIIGMKQEIPGSGQWQLLTERHDECWHCDQWIYSLVFWDADTIGRNARKKVHPKVLNQMVKKVEKLNPELELNNSQVSLNLYEGDSVNKSSSQTLKMSIPTLESSAATPEPEYTEQLELHQQASKTASKSRNFYDRKLKDQETGEPPIIFGDFTNWKGKKMIPLDDFILLLAKKYGRQNQEIQDDFLVILEEMKTNLVTQVTRRNSKYKSSMSVDLDSLHQHVTQPSNHVRCYDDLLDAQKCYFDEVVKLRQARILNNWKGVIEQYLEYRKPFLVDAYQLTSKKYSKRCPNLFVLPVFIPAGRHTYLVKNQDTFEYSMHTTIADFRTEDPPMLIKELQQKNAVQRTFRKDNSVFEPWKEDNELNLQLACENDIGSSKLTKIVKEPLEQAKVQEFIFEKFTDLKLLFLKYSCISNYPNISQLTMDQLCDEFQVLDENFKRSDLHIAFTACCQKPPKGQTKMGLNRAEFIEIMVRIALGKFLKPGIVETASQAVQKFLNEVIFAEWQVTPGWQDFRSRYLWTLDVNDVLQANIFGLQKLYNRNQTIHKTWLELQEAIHLFSIETNLLPEYQVKICYGFSKMTMSDEVQSQPQHNCMNFAEFLELIGRVSVAYWEQNNEHLEEVPLAKKIEFILDQLLAVVNIKRNEVTANDESDSESEDDY